MHLFCGSALVALVRVLALSTACVAWLVAATLGLFCIGADALIACQDAAITARG